MLWIWESEVEDSNSWCQGRDVQIRERGREVSFLIPSPPRAPRRPAAHATIRWRQHRQHHESWPTWTCAMMTDINHHVSRAAVGGTRDIIPSIQSIINNIYCLSALCGGFLQLWDTKKHPKATFTSYLKAFVNLNIHIISVAILNAQHSLHHRFGERISVVNHSYLLWLYPSTIFCWMRPEVESTAGSWSPDKHDK